MSRHEPLPKEKKGFWIEDPGPNPALLRDIHISALLPNGQPATAERSLADHREKARRNPVDAPEVGSTIDMRRP